MRPLIPNNVTVSEQFSRMAAFIRFYDKWNLRANGKYPHYKKTQDEIDQFEDTYGIKCVLKGDFQLLSPTIVDEKKYLLYILQTQ